MNAVDALLLVLAAGFALRGWVRGFCREAFALAGLVGGAVAAAAASGAFADALAARHLVPVAAARPVAALLIVLVGVVTANLVGRVVDGVVRALFLAWLNRLAGVALGVVKGATVLGLACLAVERLLPGSRAARAIMASALGRPLVEVAARVVETGRGLAPAAGSA